MSSFNPRAHVGRDNTLESVSRILVYTERPITAAGLAAVAPADWDVVHAAGPISALLAAMPTSSLALIDYDGQASLADIEILRRVTPEVPVVLWTAGDIAPELALQAIHLNVRGIVRQTLDTGLQIAALRNALAGRKHFDEGLIERAQRRKQVILSLREGQLVALLTQGKKNREIALALGVTTGTVKVYLSRLMGKLHVKDRYELALWGLENLGRHAADSADYTPRTLALPGAFA